MNMRPDPPPEGKLIAEAADNMDLSIREGARRAGISYGRWRQIVTGYQNVSPGEYAVVRAPAKTVARMARVVGVQPNQLEKAGREDAAKALRDLIPSHQDDAAGVPSSPGGTADPATIAAANAIAALMEPAIQSVWTDVRRARMRNPDASAAEIFTDPRERRIWDLDALPEDDRAGYVAFLRMKLAEENAENVTRQERPGRPRHAK